MKNERVFDKERSKIPSKVTNLRRKKVKPRARKQRKKR